MPFERSIGKRGLYYAKFTYSGVLRSLEGKWAILDGAWQHFWCDAEVRVRSETDKPIYLGDDYPLNLDYVEGHVRYESLVWADDEERLTKAKKKR
jgi:hypothetical protein